MDIEATDSCALILQLTMMMDPDELVENAQIEHLAPYLPYLGIGESLRNGHTGRGSLSVSGKETVK